MSKSTNVEQALRVFEDDERTDEIMEKGISDLPPSLVKATVDLWEYSLKLRTGEIIAFEKAEINGKWVHLTLINGLTSTNGTGEWYDLPFKRGVDVRLRDIVWCADNGH